MYLKLAFPELQNENGKFPNAIFLIKNWRFPFKICFRHRFRPRRAKKTKKRSTSRLASEGYADPGKEGLGGWVGQARSSTPSLILRMGGRIEPAEPEPPPAHSLGRAGEAAMGRLGELVRPCWLDAGGVAGGEELVARLVVRLVFSLCFCYFWSPWAIKINRNRCKGQNRRKNWKVTRKLPKPDHRLFDFGSQNGSKIY